MNTKTKRRLAVVSGVIVIFLIVALAVVGGNTSAKALSISDVVNGDYVDQKIQVSGNVVKNSYETSGKTLTFDIYDPEGDSSEVLKISYDGNVSSSFGNEVVAICTGKVGSDGVLYVSELVTKCPSKYESATEALEVARLLEYGDEVLDKTVKVTGVVKDGSLKAGGQGDRFILVDNAGSEEIAVVFDDALSDEIQEGSILVITGSLNKDGKFVATNVALKG